MTTPVPAPMPQMPQTPATLRYDPISHMHWLEFDGRPEADTIAALKRDGWRWSGYRKQWYTNRRYYAIPASITVTDGGTCDYSSERADRLNARADCHYERYQERYEKAHARASRIPFGQPILVGHHSQRRHERDIDRIHKDFGKAFEELDISKDLRSKARRSANLQAYKQTPEAMQRRVDRLRAEERQLERIINGLDEREQRYGEDVTTYRKQCDWRLDKVRAEISELEQAIKDAGGIQADQAEVQVGDLVWLRGQLVRITRVNQKTYTGLMVTDNQALNAINWPRKWDKTDLRRIERRASEPKTMNEILIEQNIAAQEEARQRAIKERQQQQDEEPGK